jgi:hypothetical protein
VCQLRNGFRGHSNEGDHAEIRAREQQGNDNKIVVLRTASGKEETFRVQNDAVIETGHGVVLFAQFEPQSDELVTLHYADPLGTVRVSRIKR